MNRSLRFSLFSLRVDHDHQPHFYLLWVNLTAGQGSHIDVHFGFN